MGWAHPLCKQKERKNEEMIPYASPAAVTHRMVRRLASQLLSLMVLLDLGKKLAYSCLQEFLTVIFI